MEFLRLNGVRIDRRAGEASGHNFVDRVDGQYIAIGRYDHRRAAYAIHDRANSTLSTAVYSDLRQDEAAIFTPLNLRLWITLNGALQHQFVTLDHVYLVSGTWVDKNGFGCKGAVLSWHSLTERISRIIEWRKVRKLEFNVLS